MFQNLSLFSLLSSQFTKFFTNKLKRRELSTGWGSQFSNNTINYNPKQAEKEQSSLEQRHLAPNWSDLYIWGKHRERPFEIKLQTFPRCLSETSFSNFDLSECDKKTSYELLFAEWFSNITQSGLDLASPLNLEQCYLCPWVEITYSRAMIKMLN